MLLRLYITFICITLKEFNIFFIGGGGERIEARPARQADI